MSTGGPEQKLGKTLEEYEKVMLKPLMEQNARLEKRLNSDWNMLRSGLGLLIAIGTLLFGAKLAFEYFVASDLRQTNKDFQAKIDDFKESLSSESDEVVARFEAAFQKKTEQLDEKVVALSRQLTELESENDTIRMSALGALGSAHSIVSHVGLARHHLIFNADFPRSQYYAEQAQSELNSSVAKLSGQPKLQLLSNSLRALQPIVWTVQAERLFEESDFLALEKLARKMVDLDCDCVEGNYYLAVALLGRNLGKPLDEDLISEIYTNLSAATGNERNETNISLLRACLDVLTGTQIENVIETSSQLVSKLGKPGGAEVMSRSPRERAYALIAETIHRAASLHSNSGKIKVADPLPGLPCYTDVGNLGRPLSQIYVRLLTQTIGQRDKLFSDVRNANLAGLYLLNAVVLIRNSCGLSSAEAEPLLESLAQYGCVNCGPTIGGGAAVGEVPLPSAHFIKLAWDHSLLPMPNFLFPINPLNLVGQENQLSLFYPREETRPFEETIEKCEVVTEVETYEVEVEDPESGDLRTVTRERTKQIVVPKPETVVFEKVRWFLEKRDIDGEKLKLVSQAVEAKGLKDIVLPSFLIREDLDYFSNTFGFSSIPVHFNPPSILSDCVLRTELGNSDVPVVAPPAPAPDADT